MTQSVNNTDLHLQAKKRLFVQLNASNPQSILVLLLKADCGANMVFVLRIFKKWQTPKVHLFIGPDLLKKCLCGPWFIIIIISGMPYWVIWLLSKYYTLKTIKKSAPCIVDLFILLYPPLNSSCMVYGIGEKQSWWVFLEFCRNLSYLSL